MLHLLYNLSLALSLSLHVFNMGGEGGFKPFYIPALISCALIFFLVPKNTKLFRCLMLFLICSFISTLVSLSSSALPGFITILIVSLSCYGVVYADLDILLKCLIIIIPFDLIVLLYEALTGFFYRFQGFYNDPNYLCTTLLVMLFICLISYKRVEMKYSKYLIVFSCVIILILIILTLSRTGLLCSIILLLVSMWNSLKKHIFKMILAFSLLIISVGYYASDLLEERWDLLYERLFLTDDNLDSASSHRGGLSLQNIYFLADHPIYLFWGLGSGTTSGDNAQEIPELSRYRYSDSRDHNTWTSCLSEQGLVALLLFAIIVYHTLRSVYVMPRGSTKNCCVGLFIVLFLFSISLWQMTYLPFWWGMFILSNNQLKVSGSNEEVF